MRYGAIYYPEHWPEDRWGRDARLMREAGFNVVRLGEFAWCRMEPEPDRYEFGWLDRAIAVLNGEGINVLIGTPTAGPPAWLVNPRPGWPDCRQVYEDGSRWESGGRSLLCVSHSLFVERSRRIAQALGAHYADHPGVMGFQIDNELGMYGTRCYCEVCHQAFRDWLKERYGRIEVMNRRLGLIFGGSEFSTFADVPIPRRYQDLHNPGLLLESQRFFSQANVRYVRVQATALRQAGVQQPITTNVCHMFSGGDAIDGRALFETLDVAGWDCYPRQFGADPAAIALLHAVARSYKNGQAHWMLEQESGSPMSAVADDPRRSRLWTWQSIAHGAAMILYFRWRTCRFGGEQYWRGILDHDGEVNARYATVARTGREVAHLAPLLDRARPENEIAILLDFDASVSLNFLAPGGEMSYRRQAEALVAATQRLGLGVDVVYEANDLQRYRLVLAPLLRLMDETLARGLQKYVREGGTLVATPLLASLDRDHVAPAEHPPYLLHDLFGLECIEWSSLSAAAFPPKELLGKDPTMWRGGSQAGSLAVRATPGGGLRGPYTGRVWADHLRAAGAASLATFDTESPTGEAPAVTMNGAGSGYAVYIASVMDGQFYEDLLALLLGPRQAAVSAADSAAMVEIVPCRADGQAIYFALNHDVEPRTLRIDGTLYDALAEQPAIGTYELPPYGVAILLDQTQTEAPLR